MSPGPRIYISVDMEGVAGVVHEDQTNPFDQRWSAEYSRACRLMTNEANAAIEGALAAGASRIVVNDSHWHMRNIIAEALHPVAELSSGSPKPWSMVHGVDAGFDALFLVGYHSRAGTAQAGIDHTYTDVIHDVRLDGESVGELGLNAALAAEHGVRTTLVTGDAAVCREASARLPGVATVVVKESLGRQAARSVHPEVACARIREGATRATAFETPIRRAGSPSTIEVDFVRTHHADMAELVPGSIRQGGRTVTFRHVDYCEVFRAWRAMYNLANVP
ncbi:MAG: M55 family metallopeptidase [Gemmatimonadales bacterium]